MKKLFFVLMMLTLISGCDGHKVMHDNRLSEPVKEWMAEEVVVEPAKADFSKYKTTVSEYSFDINKDGEDDTVTLAVSAESEKGKILWEDLHDWLLNVNISGKDYVLYDGKVSLGNVYYNVFERTDGDVVISVTEESTATYSVTEYTYTDKGFEKTECVKEEGINFMTSSAGIN